MEVQQKAKSDIIQEFGRHPDDTGSPEVQIALLTKRIDELTDHMQDHEKDFSSRKGLLKLVARRKSLLEYLKENDREKYFDVLNNLDIRGV